MEIWNIAKYDLIKLLREKTALIITFLMPVLMIGIMGSINSGGGSGSPKIPVGIVLQDRSKAAIDLLNEVKKDPTLDIQEKNEADLVDAVKNSYVDVGFTVPADYGSLLKEGKIPEIQVLKLPSSSDFMVIESAFRNAFARMNAKESTGVYFNEKLRGMKLPNQDQIASDFQQALERNFNGESAVSVSRKTYGTKTDSKKNDFRTTSTLGFTVMFVMWAVVFSAGETLQEKKNNTWGRLNLTPVSKSTIILGKMLGTFLRGWVQVVFLILFSNYVIGISWGSSILPTIVVISVFLLSVNGLGMFLSNLVKTNSQLGAISAILITCSSMLAGCYWPLEMVPDTMQKVAQIFPQYWAMKALHSTIGNQGWDALVTPLLALAGMGLLFFLLTLVHGRVRLPSRKPVLEMTKG